MECNLAKCVWALEREEIMEFICQLQTPNARAWLAKVMKVLKHEELTMVVVRLWAIWNVQRQGLKFQSLFSTHSFVESITPKNKEKAVVGSLAMR